MRRATLYAAILVAIFGAACATNPTPRVVATAAQYGDLLVQGVGAAQSAVIAAEASGLISRDKAREAVSRFVSATKLAEQSAALMERLLAASGASSRLALVAEIASLLDQIAALATSALVPINDEGLRARLSALVSQINVTVATVNREVLR